MPAGSYSSYQHCQGTVQGTILLLADIVYERESGINPFLKAAYLAKFKQFFGEEETIDLTAVSPGQARAANCAARVPSWAGGVKEISRLICIIF